MTREAVNSQILALAAQGTPLKAMARTTGVSRQTIRRIVRGQRHDIFRTRQSSLDPWLVQLEAEWTGGCHVGAELWRKLRGSGLRGDLAAPPGSRDRERPRPCAQGPARRRRRRHPAGLHPARARPPARPGAPSPARSAPAAPSARRRGTRARPTRAPTSSASFPNEDGSVRLIRAVLLEQNDEGRSRRRSMRLEAFAQIDAAESDPLPSIAPRAASPRLSDGYTEISTALTDGTCGSRSSALPSGSPPVLSRRAGRRRAIPRAWPCRSQRTRDRPGAARRACRRRPDSDSPSRARRRGRR